MGDHETRKPCATCSRPEATDHDWETVPDEGRPDLCWGPADPDCEDNRAELIASLRARCERLEGALGEIAKLADDAKETTVAGLRTHYALSQIRDRARGAVGS